MRPGAVSDPRRIVRRMPALSEIHAAAPDLAALAREVLASCPNAVLGTHRADGSIRLSGIDPTLVGGEIVLGSMPGARKLADLRRDPRMALHSVPWESRRERPGSAHVEADVKLSGRAVEVADDEHAALADAVGEAIGYRPSATEPLFRIDVTLLSSTRIVADGDRQVMEISTWTPDRGSVVVRRD